MVQLLTRWPLWYQVLIGYTAAMGVWALRDASERASALQHSSLTDLAPFDKGHLVGQHVGIWTHALSWFGGVGLLLGGAPWALALVAVGYALSARRTYNEFAQGFAEGRKSVELASAPEYVHGRVPPDTIARVVAALFVAITRLVPLGATLVAMIWLPR